jgi:hypothetical protein
MHCMPNCTLREACLVWSDQYQSVNLHVQHLMLPLHSAHCVCHGQCVLIGLCLIWLLTLVFHQCSSTISITKAVLEMHISISHISILCHYHYFAIGNNVIDNQMQYELSCGVTKALLNENIHTHTHTHQKKKKRKRKVWYAITLNSSKLDSHLFTFFAPNYLGD